MGVLEKLVGPVAPADPQGAIETCAVAIPKGGHCINGLAIEGSPTTKNWIRISSAAGSSSSL